MTAAELIRLIPAEAFDSLSVETKVDHQVKKLKGEAVFRLILFSMLNSDRLSLRIMETFLRSSRFKGFSDNDILDARYNSIRDRICTIRTEYFEGLFHTVFSTYNKLLKQEKGLMIADSTYVSLAAKLFQHGMTNGTGAYGLKQVKFSVAIKGGLPCHVRVHTDQAFISEDLALADLIQSAGHVDEGVVLFDRGLQSRKALGRFNADGRIFIGRCSPRTQCKTTKVVPTTIAPEGCGLIVTSDLIGHLSDRHRPTTDVFRVIHCTLIGSGEPISFVTNMFDENPYVIAELYRNRWQIEVFFRFIKQHLNFKHLVSRDLNGIKVMVYMTLILATLILVYKKLNNVSGYKIAKLQFNLDLENSIIRDIVQLCGGDPSKAEHLWNSS